jgi:putative ABC transport system substrate-binding protein
MRRREFTCLFRGAAVSAVLWPLATLAQDGGRMRRIGVLLPFAVNDPDWQVRIQVLKQELQTLGWSEGRNVRFDYRWSGADPDRMRIDAAELIGLAPHVIVTASNRATSIVSRQTRTIPIVFTGGDPLGTGLISNMARPGGNITGFAIYESELAGKWLELLKNVAPHITRVAVLYTAGGQASLAILRTINSVVASFGVQPTSFPVNGAEDIERAIGRFSQEPNGGLIVLSGPATTNNRSLIVAIATKHRLPAIYPARSYANIGGLMSYSSTDIDLYRRVAAYVDRILNGEKPGDLPVQGPTKYALVVNLKSAKSQGITIPPTLLALADEVIE